MKQVTIIFKTRFFFASRTSYLLSKFPVVFRLIVNPNYLEIKSYAIEIIKEMNPGMMKQYICLFIDLSMKLTSNTNKGKVEICKIQLMIITQYLCQSESVWQNAINTNIIKIKIKPQMIPKDIFRSSSRSMYSSFLEIYKYVEILLRKTKS